jgi:hypothetical protein
MLVRVENPLPPPRTPSESGCGQGAVPHPRVAATTLRQGHGGGPASATALGRRSEPGPVTLGEPRAVACEGLCGPLNCATRCGSTRVPVKAHDRCVTAVVLRPAEYSCKTSPFAFRFFWHCRASRKELQVIAVNLQRII